MIHHEGPHLVAVGATLSEFESTLELGRFNVLILRRGVRPSENRRYAQVSSAAESYWAE